MSIVKISTKVTAILSVVCFLWPVTAAWAQVGGGPGGGALRVPIAECSSNCSPPTDNDFCCIANQTWCRRIDGTPSVTFPGTPLIVAGSLTCFNCNEEADPGCPENPPSRDLVCRLGTTLSETQTATATISSEITVGVPGVEASLGAALGTTVGVTVTVESTCEYPTPPCKIATISGTLLGTMGKTVEMTHTWTTGGTWGDRYVWCDCVISGNIWQQPCGTGTSTGMANLWANGTCVLLSEVDCTTIE